MKNLLSMIDKSITMLVLLVIADLIGCVVLESREDFKLMQITATTFFALLIGIILLSAIKFFIMWRSKDDEEGE